MATVIEPPVREPPVREPAAIPTEPIRRLTVNEYHFLVNAGIFDEDDDVELLEGYLVEKMSKNRIHAIVNQLLYEYLKRILPNGWHVQAQEPITTETSEPEPDAAVIRGSLLDFPTDHPFADDAAIVVEVADTSLRRDRTTKMRIYASAGIPLYWIVNIPENQIEIYSEPSGPITEPAYRQQRTYSHGSQFEVYLDGEMIDTLSVDELLPR